jgi:glycosyltransferase involved in cell wall biosynthesis
MRILISAYACAPASGSEPGVGWNWAVQAARHGHDVVVVTRSNNRSAIDTYLRDEDIPNLTFVYVDIPFLANLKSRIGYRALHAYYYIWQVRLGLVARRLHATHPFDVIHHITFVNDWMPSGLAAVRAPFIWGPIGGSTHVMPPGFDPTLTESRRFERMRSGAQLLLGRLDPFVALTRRRSDVILTYTDEALDGIPERLRVKSRSIVHIGVSISDALIEGAAMKPPPSSPFTIVTGGRLVHWKGFDLLLEGFANFAKSSPSDAQLWITGEGPTRARLESYSARSGIADRVHFIGQLETRDDVLRVVALGHLYALPTLRDGPPTAILEAMVMAKPILCLDLGATRELVPDFAGFKIPVTDRAQVVEGISDALSWAATHYEETVAMGEAARTYVLERHNWDRIGDEVDAIYHSLAA